MDNKTRKKKVIKWLLIGIGCAVVLWISISIDSSLAHHNKMEYMTHGGIYADPNSINIISKSNPLWVSAACGIVVSFLGLILSTIMFVVSVISCWINSTPTVVQQVTKTSSDTLIQLSKLYKEGLLTKEEFEMKKKQLLGGKQNG